MSGKVGSGSFSVLLVDGYDLLAAKVKTFTHKIAALNEPSHGLGDGTEGKTPTGLVQVALTQGGAFFDDAANGAHVLLSPVANLQVSRVLAFAVRRQHDRQAVRRDERRLRHELRRDQSGRRADEGQRRV